MKLVIFGSREFAETVAELAKDCGYEVAGFIDDYSSGPNILGTLAQVRKSHPPEEYGIAIAVGYSNLPARWQAWQKVIEMGYVAPPLIHPRAYVATSVKVGAGAMLMATSAIDVRVDIGEIVVVWPGVCVSHDSVVGENCFLSPNSTICGYVNLGAHSFVGAAAAIVDHCTVPPSTRIRMQGSYTKVCS